MRRGIHPRKPRKLGRVWLVDHPGCPGLIPDTGEGWVYACTGVGPRAEFIKIGCTSRTPSDRMDDLYLDYFYRVRLSQITVWGRIPLSDTGMSVASAKRSQTTAFHASLIWALKSSARRCQAGGECDMNTGVAQRGP